MSTRENIRLIARAPLICQETWMPGGVAGFPYIPYKKLETSPLKPFFRI